MSRSQHVSTVRARARLIGTGAVAGLLLGAIALPAAAQQAAPAADESLLHSPTWQMPQQAGGQPAMPAAAPQAAPGAEAVRFRPLTPEPPQPAAASTPPPQPAPSPEPPAAAPEPPAAAPQAAEAEKPAPETQPETQPRSAAASPRSRSDALRQQMLTRHPRRAMHRRRPPNPRLLQHWMMHPNSGAAARYLPYYYPNYGMTAPQQ